MAKLTRCKLIAAAAVAPLAGAAGAAPTTKADPLVARVRAWIAAQDAADAANAINGASNAARAAERIIPEITYTRDQLQHAFKHAGDFGNPGNASNGTMAEFSTAIQNHIAAPGTQAIQGTYRGQAVTHFLDPNSGLNVIRDSSGSFLSGWKLSPKQLEYVTTTGKLGGGR